MADVKQFNIDGTNIAVKDETARSDASNAVTIANEALDLAEYIESLARLEISYNSSTETITFTRTTHEAQQGGGNG